MSDQKKALVFLVSTRDFLRPSRSGDQIELASKDFPLVVILEGTQEHSTKHIAHESQEVPAVAERVFSHPSRLLGTSRGEIASQAHEKVFAKKDLVLFDNVFEIEINKNKMLMEKHRNVNTVAEQ